VALFILGGRATLARRSSHLSCFSSPSPGLVWSVILPVVSFFFFYTCDTTDSLDETLLPTNWVAWRKVCCWFV
jgi:hypothetical protein